MKNAVLGLLGLILCSSPAYATPVQLEMPNGLIANAEYNQGQAGKPAVFLLHGFLQTYHFPTISRLTNSIKDEGYTTLSPSMTLGVPDRRQSVACEALHDHTVADDVKEIDAWMKWLKRKGHDSVIFVAHSQGNTSLIDYLEKTKSNNVKKLIAVSIVEVMMSNKAEENSEWLRKLKVSIKNKERKPFVNSLSFCAKYLGTPQSFYSYQSWSPERILKSLDGLKIPVSIIMGSGDDRLQKGWITRLKNTPAEIHIINGANHFMDGSNEFDLLDVVLEKIKS